MAHPPRVVTHANTECRFEGSRIDAFVKVVESMAAGDTSVRLPISPDHDALDALAFGINSLVGEVAWAAERARLTLEERAAELQAAAGLAEARTSAMLRAIPDLMIVLSRDGTYVDYHARDPRLLFVPPHELLGRNVRDVLPPAITDTIMNALERAWHSTDPVVVEYELPMDEARVFEARIVRTGDDRLLSIVRDVTEARRASARIHDLAQRLITSQESERRRIARELHDDISNRIALLKIEVDTLGVKEDPASLSARLQTLSGHLDSVARAVHALAHELHPAKLQFLNLAGAIQSVCQEAQQRNLHVAFEQHGLLPARVDPELAVTLYRIVQEALLNVVRHSHTREAQVTLSFDEDHLTMDIVDAGVGFDPSHRSPRPGPDQHRGARGSPERTARHRLGSGPGDEDTPAGSSFRGRRLSVNRRHRLAQGARSARPIEHRDDLAMPHLLRPRARRGP